MKLLVVLLLLVVGQEYANAKQIYALDAFFRQYIGASAINVEIFEGGGLSARHAHDLSCDFRKGVPCCWMNTAAVTDEVTWWRADSKHINKEKMNIPYGVDVEGSIIFAGYPQTSSVRQAILVSCPIACQKGNGTLTLMHMHSEHVTLDVCTLKIGERKYKPNACAKLDTTRTTSVVIVPEDGPFQILLVASNFIRGQIKSDRGGGLVAIDDISYQADICEV